MRAALPKHAVPSHERKVDSESRLEIQSDFHQEQSIAAERPDYLLDFSTRQASTVAPDDRRFERRKPRKEWLILDEDSGSRDGVQVLSNPRVSLDCGLAAD